MRTAAALVLLSACGFPTIEGEVVTHGRHLTLHADPALPVCAATIDEADAFIELAVAYLDAAPAPDVDYYLHDGNPSGCRLVGEDPVACTHYETIHTASWIHYHELVHTIVRDWGRPPAFLLEGLAEGLGTKYPQLLPHTRMTAELPLESTAFFAGDNVGHNYQVAADFVVYLLHRFGPGVYHQLARALPYLADELTIRTTFRDLTGADLGSVIADWRAAPTDAAHDLPRDRAPCAAAVLPPLAPETWQREEPAECRSGTSAGGSVLNQPVAHVVDLAAEGVFVVAMTSAQPAGAPFAVVSDCAGDDPRLETDRGRAVQVFDAGLLAAGPHAVEATSNQIAIEPDPGPITWSLTGLGAQRATCEGAPVFTAPAGPWVLTFTSDRARWPAGATDRESWLRFELGPEDVELSLSLVGITPDTVVCSGPCDAPVACEPAGTRYMPVAGQPVYLDLHATASSGGVFVTVGSNHSTTAMRGPATTARSLVPR